MGPNVIILKPAKVQSFQSKCTSRCGSADAGSPMLRVCEKIRTVSRNTVVGFIGPEYLYDAKQVIRAGLEDHFRAN